MSFKFWGNAICGACNMWAFAQWGWGAGCVDFQNDGRPDLYAMTGFITSPLEDDL